jgi:N utilization substance protein A
MKIAPTQTIGRKKPAAPEKQVRKVRRKGQSVDTTAFPPEEPFSRSSGQSGDLQGLSDVEGADSESVKELLEEGNAFEADAVMGVELAGDTEGGEVHTHELPEDDVPGEYLDEE